MLIHWIPSALLLYYMVSYIKKLTLHKNNKYLNIKYLKFLCIACFRGYDQQEEEAVEARIACVKLLVEAGADVNFQKMGTLMTALHWASFNDDRQVVLYLLNNNAKMLYDEKDETPLDLAGVCENEEVTILTILIFFHLDRFYYSESLVAKLIQNSTTYCEG